jgi:hypothetical protein
MERKCSHLILSTALCAWISLVSTRNLTSLVDASSKASFMLSYTLGPFVTFKKLDYLTVLWNRKTGAKIITNYRVEPEPEPLLVKKLEPEP